MDLQLFAENEIKTKKIYRVVGAEEYEDIMRTGRFNEKRECLAAKQFANNFDELLKWAGKLINKDKAAILEVTVPESIYNRLNHMELDLHELSSGTVTVEPEMLNEFNDMIFSINYIY